MTVKNLPYTKKPMWHQMRYSGGDVTIGKGTVVLYGAVITDEGGPEHIGWIAVGNPAKMLPPDKHDEIWDMQKEQDFPGTVWSVDRTISKEDRTRRYARALRRHHKKDERVNRRH